MPKLSAGFFREEDELSDSGADGEPAAAVADAVADGVAAARADLAEAKRELTRLKAGEAGKAEIDAARRRWQAAKKRAKALEAGGGASLEGSGQEGEEGAERSRATAAVSDAGPTTSSTGSELRERLRGRVRALHTELVGAPPSEELPLAQWVGQLERVVHRGELEAIAARVGALEGERAVLRSIAADV